MSEPIDDSACFPLLAQLSRQRGIKILPVYKMTDAAALFGVKSRTLNDWVANGRLTVRDLPGRGRFLPRDLEDFLAGSAKARKPNAEHQSDELRRRRQKP